MRLQGLFRLLLLVRLVHVAFAHIVPNGGRHTGPEYAVFGPADASLRPNMRLVDAGQGVGPQCLGNNTLIATIEDSFLYHKLVANLKIWD